MKYLVSIENTNYFYWQTELLIESFLMNGIQDDLVIAIANNDSPKIKGYSKNLVKHKNKILHENVGLEKECPVANRVYAIRNLFLTEQIELPFTVIHADMIMKNPIDKYNKDTEIVMNNYGMEINKLTNSYIENIGLKQQLLDEEKITEKEIDEFPFCMPIIFNENLDKEFFLKFLDKLVINLEDVCKKKNFPVEQTCWTQTLLESYGFYSATGSFLTCELMHSEDFDVPFIHYNNGIPPIFNKKFFKFDKGKYYVDGPYENLLENNINENTEYVRQVIRSYMKRNH